ncbi:hypothetical protein RSOLAG22IIIB_03219 [Rhizoctonia solani]|uniref:Uncharacterized protein n=1 Tax=Rhizoctonia solani TaxID=456999 RepID=A0A0K6FNE2_9AGAM|nr:hypothetical protein RSOLAG22IIIB_03219 [Rhizoctonia solani]
MASNAQAVAVPDNGAMIRRRPVWGVGGLIAKSASGLVNVPGLKDVVLFAKEGAKTLKPDIFQAPKVNDAQTKKQIDSIKGLLDRMASVDAALAAARNTDIPVSRSINQGELDEVESFRQGMMAFRSELENTLNEKYSSKFTRQREIAQFLTQKNEQVSECVADFCEACESLESAHLLGTYPYPNQPVQTPSTIKPHVLRSIMTTPSSGSSTPASVTSTTTHPSGILVTPASAISAISPVRERGFFGRPMTHGQSAFAEATTGTAARSHEGEDDDAKTEIGSPEEDMDHEELGGGGGLGIRLPPIQTLPPMAPIYTVPTTISQDVLLYGPAGITPSPTELQHHKLPPVPAFAPPRLATFFGIQNISVTDGNTRFVTMCAPGVCPVSASSRPAYPCRSSSSCRGTPSIASRRAHRPYRVRGQSCRIEGAPARQGEG